MHSSVCSISVFVDEYFVFVADHVYPFVLHHLNSGLQEGNFRINIGFQIEIFHGSKDELNQL